MATGVSVRFRALAINGFRIGQKQASRMIKPCLPRRPLSSSPLSPSLFLSPPPSPPFCPLACPYFSLTRRPVAEHWNFGNLVVFKRQARTVYIVAQSPVLFTQSPLEDKPPPLLPLQCPRRDPLVGSKITTATYQPVGPWSSDGGYATQVRTTSSGFKRRCTGHTAT